MTLIALKKGWQHFNLNHLQSHTLELAPFPDPAHARVIWAGVDPDGVQKLTSLANEVVAEMSELGFKADKPFSAHLTLIRAKGKAVSAS